MPPPDSETPSTGKSACLRPSGVSPGTLLLLVVLLSPRSGAAPRTHRAWTGTLPVNPLPLSNGRADQSALDAA